MCDILPVMTLDVIVERLLVAAGTRLPHCLLYDGHREEKEQVSQALVMGGGRVWPSRGHHFEKPGDLTAVVTNLGAGDVLLIDDVDRMGVDSQELLVGVVERSAIEVIIGQGPTARSLVIELPPLTVVAATLKPAGIERSLREAIHFHIDCVMPLLETTDQVLARERAEKRAKRLRQTK